MFSPKAVVCQPLLESPEGTSLEKYWTVKEIWGGYSRKFLPRNPILCNKNPQVFKGSVGRTTCLVFNIILELSQTVSFERDERDKMLLALTMMARCSTGPENPCQPTPLLTLVTQRSPLTTGRGKKE